MKKAVVELNNMASTFIGSVILMASCFESEYSSEEKKIELFWKYTKIGKNPKKYFKSIDDTWNIDRILEAFNIARTWNWPVCLVTSDKNCLLCPFATDEDKIIPLSPRTDGLPGYTLRHVKTIQLINWDHEQSAVNTAEPAAV